MVVNMFYRRERPDAGAVTFGRIHSGAYNDNANDTNDNRNNDSNDNNSANENSNDNNNNDNISLRMIMILIQQTVQGFSRVVWRLRFWKTKLKTCVRMTAGSPAAYLYMCVYC